jgi:triosephosphate isomerase
MRRPMVVANWKMYTRASDAYVLATTIRNQVAVIDGVEVVICPPSVWLSEVSDIVKKDGKVNVGAQNIFYEEEGPYTGEISPIMIRDIAKYVIVGHSERRFHFGESDIDVNEKVIAALKHGLSPIICVGEKTKNASIGEAVGQLTEALRHIPKKNYQDCVVAYEPTWAIDGSDAAPIARVERAIIRLREDIGRDSPILYGGSINNKDVGEFAHNPHIDGVLVGSASLRAGVFIEICKVWAEAKSFK